VRDADDPWAQAFTVEAAALLLGRSRRTIWNLLSSHAAKFSEPMYVKLRGPQRRRVLTEQDMAALHALIPRPEPRVKCRPEPNGRRPTFTADTYRQRS
jgi:hypothetical protein